MFFSPNPLGYSQLTFDLLFFLEFWIFGYFLLSSSSLECLEPTIFDLGRLLRFFSDFWVMFCGSVKDFDAFGLHFWSDHWIWPSPEVLHWSSGHFFGGPGLTVDTVGFFLRFWPNFIPSWPFADFLNPPFTLSDPHWGPCSIFLVQDLILQDLFPRRERFPSDPLSPPDPSGDTCRCCALQNVPDFIFRFSSAAQKKKSALIDFGLDESVS